MEFGFTSEQEQFREGLARFLRQRSPTTEVRRLMASAEGFDPEVWRALSRDLALPAIRIPDRYGGAGFGTVELGIVMEESGRALLCAPYLSSAVLGSGAIWRAGTEDQREALLPGLASGELRAALAITESDGRPDLDGIRLDAKARGDAWVLNGVKSFVIDGHTADLLVVAARSARGISLYTVDGASSGVTRRPLPVMDPTRKLAEVRFDDARATLLGEAGAATDALTATLDEAAVALANEMVGGAQALLDSAVAYAKMRVQFGRTIGSFQAIKHKCADMLLDVESAKSAAYCAAQAMASGDVETPALASLAKAAAADAYLRTAAQTIQIHGGIGFTWENDTHLWFKRAKSSEMLLGSPDYHRELMLRRWGY